MRYFLNLPFLALLLISFLTTTAQTIPESRAVEAYAISNATSKTITIHWAKTSDAQNFAVYKRTPGDQTWGNPIVNQQASGDTFFIDTDVTLGEECEYNVVKLTNTPDPLTSNNDIRGYGYLTASIEKNAIHSRGTLWVLVADNLGTGLADEVKQLENDLIGDGWEVYSEIILSSVSPQELKTLIELKKAQNGCDAIYIIGHVAVPYSGTFCTDLSYQVPPDGHTAAAPPSHCGAWPSDLYYGVFSNNWTDNDVDSTGSRELNKNRKGDGKYDNNSIPGTVEVAIGRVDFSDLPKFSKNEVELTRQYLNKVHEFKIGQTTVLQQGIIEDNFRSGGAAREGFSSAAIRDFSAILGPNKTINADIFNTTRTGDYLLSYGCGAGSFTSCSGVGRTDSFVNHNAAAFNQLFGSYFGDWDSRNNLMRSSLASTKLGFTCVWSGRPKWVTHPLALGATFGDITKLSMNNLRDYDGSYFQNGTHMALLGDPSLRVHPIKPAAGISLEASPDRDATTIAWTASDESKISGYYVYRSHKGHGGFVLINETPTNDLSLVDNNPYQGTNHYMVRTAKLTTSGSGTYENLSLGIRAEITDMQGVKARINEIAFAALKVYPTLSHNTITIEKSTAELMKYRIMNSLGQQVKEGELHGIKTTVEINTLPRGTYFITAGVTSAKFIKQ